MRRFDIAIVGAGITGCAIARQLSRYELDIALVEAGNDVALGSTKANGGLVHAGYDPAPGTAKAAVNARGCELYGTWADELGFAFERPGSMVLGFDEADRAHLRTLLENGEANGVPGGDRRRRSHTRARAAGEPRCDVRAMEPLHRLRGPLRGRHRRRGERRGQRG